MADYIRRADALSALDKVVRGIRLAPAHRKQILGIVEEVPPVEIHDGEHSSWMRDKSGIFHCRKCDFMLGFGTPYCPKCGAKMDRECEGCHFWHQTAKVCCNLDSEHFMNYYSNGCSSKEDE